MVESRSIFIEKKGINRSKPTFYQHKSHKKCTKVRALLAQLFKFRFCE